MKKLTLIVALIFMLTGCVTRRVTRELVAVENAKKLTSTYLKVHLKNAGVMVLSSWTIDKEAKRISGTGRSYDFNRRLQLTGELSVPFDEVVVVETNDKSTNPGVATLVVLGASSAAVSLLCLISPKSCFGSCPTFFVAGDTSLHLVAEGFSSSISKSLEETDVDRIGHQMVAGPVRITMKNEALETHMVKQVNLLAVNKMLNEHVFRDGAGDFYRVKDLKAPQVATYQDQSVKAKLAFQDNSEWFDLADPLNLLEKEEIYLEFDDPRTPAAIILDKRQSLLTTYLFYHSLALTGGATAYYMAELENGDRFMNKRIHTLYDLLGGIEISYQDEKGKWQALDVVREAGPIASDAHLIHLPTSPQKVRHIKLRMTKGLWRIDRVNMVSVISKAIPNRLQPSEVVKDGKADVVALDLMLNKANYLVTFPGDVYQIQYPTEYAPTKEYFLESEGYYIEWMRDEWMKEQDLKSARKMLLRPEAYLKQMAPHFKQAEPSMEQVFWNSRYSNPNEK